MFIRSGSAGLSQSHSHPLVTGSLGVLLAALAIQIGGSVTGVAHAQQWVPPPVAIMPGTHIPYPPTYIPPPVQSHVYSSPTFMPGMQTVPDPANPRQYLGAVPPERFTPAQRQYASRFISLDEIRMINPWNGEVMRTQVQPTEGIYQSPLALQDFYYRIGGKEIGDSFVSRRRTRRGLIGAGVVGLSVGGVLSIVGGTLFMMAALDSPDRITGKCTYSLVGCQTSVRRGYGAMMGVGLGLLIGGAIALPIGVSHKADPISASAARQLTDEYNQELRQQLALSPRAARPAPQPEAETETETETDDSPAPSK